MVRLWGLVQSAGQFTTNDVVVQIVPGIIEVQKLQAYWYKLVGKQCGRGR